ncbi:kinase-like domain-containing protein [Mycena crocata]|nr:kinase-like domain-containing protein [Mycena crocata]
MKSCARQLAPKRIAATKRSHKRSLATACAIQPYSSPLPPARDKHRSAETPSKYSTEFALPESDESFFRYTSGRWLYNESQQMAQRYTKFDVPALNRVISSVCGGASVLFMQKKEGVFNKSFIATLTNGRQVVARIKNPVAGPAHLCTASEVATMDFARNVLGVPVPKVLTWSSQAATNGVGAEFIVMQSAPGVQLSAIWSTLGPRDKKNIVNSLIATEQRLLEARFSHYGSLYYKTDVPSSSQAPLSNDKFCIGPIADRTFYEDERASMPLDRGPWKDCADYLHAIAAREEAWIASHAKPHIHDDPFRAVVGPQLQDEHLSVLSQYRSVIPALVPADEKALTSVLWHPDLNPGNIFVSPKEDFRVVSIIDWQGAWAGPAYLQMNTPTFVEYTGLDASLIPSGLAFPELPDAYNAMSPEQQAAAQRNHKDKILKKLYEITQLVPYRDGLPLRRIMTLPVRSASRTWKDGILPLKLALLEVAAQWPALSTPGTLCPLRVTRADADNLGAQRERYVEWHAFLDDLRRTFGMRVHGWVSTGEYRQKRKLLDETMGVLDEGLRREMDLALPGGWWPFRDTVQ